MNYPEQELGPGSLPNHMVQYCRICAMNGYPLEGIRRLFNGREINTVDYFSGKRHVCKSNKDRWLVIP